MLNLEATLIVFRESLEGLLIVGILLGLVTKLGRPERRIPLLLGAAAALASTLLLGFIADEAARNFLEEQGGEALFSACAALLAVALLTYMVVWMYKHTLSLVRDMHGKAKQALAAGTPWVFFVLAFAAVGREGVETVLFFATLAPTETATTLGVSALAGFVASLVVALLLMGGIVRLNVQKFFAASGLLLVVFAAGLLAGGVHALGEAHVIPELAPAWSTHDILSEESNAGGILHATLGYLDSPTWLEAGVWLAYLATMGYWYTRKMRPGLRDSTDHDAADVDVAPR